MKNGLLQSMKYLLIAVGTVLVLLLVVGLVLALDWPWWVAVFLCLLIAGGVLGWFLGRKIWLRRREQVFALEVAAEEEKRVSKIASADRGNGKILRDRWKEAVETLRNSHLKKQGNPLYVLPWFLVIGESGAGKTTSLSSARLPSPFGGGTSAPVSGTMNCDWWFCERSIIIDTAGRYAVPVDEDRDREEWGNFLRLLVKHRRREPLNGLLLTISADRLIEDNAGRLEEEGRTMRRRVDELMRSVGVRVPVYLLVTKCDLIRGMTRFCSILPEKVLDQPMGMMKQDDAQDPETFAEAALKAVCERLRNLRLLLLREQREADAAVLLFPEEFQGMRSGLAAFMKGAFRENPYQETPFLRGIFFGSGRQEGRERSRFAGDLRFSNAAEPLPGTARGFFLHDLFDRILPSERSLLAPTKRFLEWRQATGNLALVSYVVVAAALCGLLTFSFVRNLNTIRSFSRDFAGFSTLKTSATDLTEMERLRGAILKVEERNRRWWIPRFGLTASVKVEKELKSLYCRRFHDTFLAAYDQQLAAAVGRMNEGTQEELFGRTVLHLARRVNILNERDRGKNLEKLRAMPQPPQLAIGGLDEGKTFGPLYLSYVLWLAETGDLQKDVTTLQTMLRGLLPRKGANVRWLAVVVDRHSGLPQVTLAEYWGGTPLPTDPAVSPAFTAKGKKAAEEIAAEVERALPEEARKDVRRAEFARWYPGAAQEAWFSFLTAFPRGVERVKGERAWQEAAARMATPQNPCFILLGRLAGEVADIASDAPQPAWLAQAARLEQARMAGTAPLAKAAETSKKLIGGIEKKIGKDAGIAALTDGPLSWQQYGTALAAIAPAAASRNQAYQLAAQVFADPAGGGTPVHQAFGAAGKLVSYGAAGSVADAAIARLVYLPADFLWKHVRNETALLLQSQWDEQVVAGTSGLPPQQAMAILAGPDGTAWRFVKGPAAPFLSRSGGGFSSREALGGRIPLDTSLFSFLDKGAKAQAAVLTRQQSYNVGIKGLPTAANDDAKLQPHGTRLELQCGASSQTLVNNNYPVGKTFYWSPDTCADVSLTIEVGDVALAKRYLGPTGFTDFLSDFRSGQRTFSAREFPGERSALDKIDVKQITVAYYFTGAGTVLKQAAALNGVVPRSIAR